MYVIGHLGKVSLDIHSHFKLVLLENEKSNAFDPIFVLLIHNNLFIEFFKFTLTQQQYDSRTGVRLYECYKFKEGSLQTG